LGIDRGFVIEGKTLGHESNGLLDYHIVFCDILAISGVVAVWADRPRLVFGGSA
jgi:hypothetical protein